MKQELLDLCARAVEMSRKAGADDCKATLSRGRFVEVQYRQRKPEVLREASAQKLAVEIYADGRYSEQTTSDLRPGPLGKFLKEAVSATKLLAKDTYRSLPDAKYYGGRTTTDLKICDAMHEKWTTERRHEAARTVESTCIVLGGNKVMSATGSAVDQAGASAVVASNGLEGYTEATYYSIGAEVTLWDKGNRQPESYFYVSARESSGLPDFVTIGRTAVKRTVAMFGAKKIDTETLPVIVENEHVPRILSGLVQAMYGSSVQQKRSFLADKKGQKIGSGILTLVDDPHLVGGLGSMAYDGDGMATRRRVMLEAGVLKDYFVDWYYSRKLGWEPTTGGPSNVLIPPGKRPVEEIMKDLGRGILVTGFIGGNSNSTTGDFSAGIQGQLFENGKVVQPVAEMNIAGNHLSFWNKLAEAANDPWMYGSWRLPSLVFNDVVVSGV